MNAHILGATRVALALPVVILAACGGGSSSAPAQPVPDFNISVAQRAAASCSAACRRRSSILRLLKSNHGWLPNGSERTIHAESADFRKKPYTNAAKSARSAVDSGRGDGRFGALLRRSTRKWHPVVHTGRAISSSH